MLFRSAAGQNQDTLWNLAVEAGAPANADYQLAMRFLSGYEMYANVTLEFGLARWSEQPPPMIPDEVPGARAKALGTRGGSETEDTDDEKGYTTLTKKSLKRIKKRAGAPKWTIRLAKVIQQLWGEDEEPAEAAVLVWKVIIKLDVSGKEHLKGRAKEDKKKAKRRAKKDKKKKKGKKSKKKKHSSSSSDSSSSSSSSSSYSSSSSSSSSSGGSKSKKKRKGKERYTSSGSRRQPEFKLMDGIKHFRDKQGNWIRCDKPPLTACRICQGKHWWWEGNEHGCAGSR